MAEAPATEKQQQAAPAQTPEEKLKAFLQANPDVSPVVVQAGRQAFQTDAEALKKRNSEIAQERDRYKTAASLDAETLANLTTLTTLQEEAIALSAEQGVPEDLLRDFAAKGAKPTEIRAYARKLQAALKPAAATGSQSTPMGNEDMAARTAAVEKSLDGAGKAKGAATERLLSPSGGGAQMPPTLDELRGQVLRERNPAKLKVLKQQLSSQLAAQGLDMQYRG